MGEQRITLNVNGRDYDISIEPDMVLADVLREKLDLTGTKVSCREGECGACTILMDGKACLSCLTLAVQAQGKKIVTIEGLAEKGQLHPIQKPLLIMVRSVRLLYSKNDHVRKSIIDENQSHSR